MEKDVVCGMSVDPKTADAKSEYKDKTYYFCCDGCKASFDEHPEQFLGVNAGSPSGHCCH